MVRLKHGKNDDGREDVKMDAKEAIERLKNYPKDSITGTGKLVLSSEIELAISALEKVETLEAENARLREKETPKEPRYVKEGDAYCPICGDSVNAWLGDEFISDEFISYKFCSNCGQAIKNDKE